MLTGILGSRRAAKRSSWRAADAKRRQGDTLSMVRALGLLWAAVVVAGLAAPGAARALEPAVGRVERAGGGICTGTLIGADVVLTAAHCVFDAETGARVAPDRLTFRAGAAGDRERARAAVRRIELSDSYRYTPKPTRLSQIRCDLALLHLARPLGDEAAPLGLAPSDAVRESFDAIGYPSYAPRHQRKQYACTRSKRTVPEGLWPTTCFAFPGVSGAPLVTPTRPPKVFGLIVARWERISVAVPLTAKGCALRQATAADGGG
jgi:hypothetical protein